MLLVVGGLFVLGQAAEDCAGLHVVAVDDKVPAFGVGTQRGLFVQVRHAVDAVLLVEVMAQVEILVVGRVHNREVQRCAVNGNPADEVSVLIFQRGKLGTVGVDVFPRCGRFRRGGGIDHRLQVGKLALGLFIIDKALDQQPSAD